jgi:hypothetical protein
VELEEIHALQPQAAQAGLQQARHRARHVPEVGGLQSELGAHVHAGLEAPEHLAEVLLRPPVPVGGGGVEVVDPQLHGARHRALALGQRAADDQPAHVAAAESQRRYAQTRSPQSSVVHGQSLRPISEK